MRGRAWSGVVLGAAAVTPRAWGHGGDESLSLWSWNFDWLLTGSLAVAAGLYGLGLARLWGSAGVGRGIRRREAWSFAAGMLTLVIALLSPVDLYAEALNWVHMVQHMLLMMVAAPLCIMGGPGIVAIWALPAGWRPRAGAAVQVLERWRIRRYFLWQPLLLWLLFAFTLWVWHLPYLYEAALRHPRLHDVQHLGFFLAACLFWRILLDPLSRLRLNPALAVLYLFTASLHATLLGVFMALSPRPWYGWYLGRTEAWELSALEDQQLAGFIMWMPACMIYALAAAMIFGVWLQRPGGHRSERGGAAASS